MGKFIQPKKSLGQNFLKNDFAAARIVSLLDINDNDIVLEIGPGTGALTEHLVKSPAKIIHALEIDQRAVDVLLVKYKEFVPDKLIIHKLDFTKSDPLSVVKPDGDKIKVIGNIPYYISSEIIFFVLDNYKNISKAVFTVQKEVAQRIVSKPDNRIYGIPAVMASLVGKARSAFDLPPGSFYPPPKVKSAVIVLDITKDDLDTIKYKSVKKLVRAAFNQRRKKMSNAISGFLNPNMIITDEVRKLLDKRAENLSSDDYLYLSEFLSTSQNLRNDGED